MKEETRDTIIICIICISIILVLSIGIIICKVYYDKGYNNASYDWCLVFNKHSDITNEIIVDYNVNIDKLGKINCSNGEIIK